MKFITSKTNLLNTLQKVVRAVSLKAPLPILEGILFEVHNNHLTITATNLDISIQCTTKINSSRDGSIVLPSRYITEIVRRLPDTGDIEIESPACQTGGNDKNVCLRYYLGASDEQDLSAGPARQAVRHDSSNMVDNLTACQTGETAGRETTEEKTIQQPDRQTDAYPITSRPGSRPGLSEAVIQGFDSSSFPVFPFNSNLKTLLSIKADFLSEALKRVFFAVSSDESRPVFTGVLFQIRPEDCNTGFLKLVATDTHRLVCKTLLSGTCNLKPDAMLTKGTDVQDAYEDGLINIIVPGRNLNELTRILNQAPEDEVEISLGDNQIFFIIKSADGEEDEREKYPTILVSRLIAGQFPLYQQVIPQEFKFSVSLRTNELKTAVERAMLFTRENISLVNLYFIGQASDEQDPSLGLLSKETTGERTIQQPDSPTVRQADAYPKGLSKCVISAQTEAGGIKEVLTFLSGDLPCPTCSIYFNAHYLAEALRAIPTKEVYLNITGPLSAMVMYPVAGSPGFQTVVGSNKTTPGEDAYSAYSKQPITDYLSLLLPARYEE
ncbi:MAG: hypothetical protein STSR0004_14060 [Peptococcaceae bacterium]